MSIWVINIHWMFGNTHQEQLQSQQSIQQLIHLWLRWLGSFPSRNVLSSVLPTNLGATDQIIANYFSITSAEMELPVLDELESWNHFECPKSFNCSFTSTFLQWFTISTATKSCKLWNCVVFIVNCASK